MHHRSFGRVAAVAAACGLGVACGGSTPASSTDPGASVAAETASSPLSPAARGASLGHRLALRRRAARAHGPLGADYAYAAFSVCSSGAYCPTPTTQFFGEFYTQEDVAPDAGPECSFIGRGPCQTAICSTSGGGGGGTVVHGAGTLTISGGAIGSVPLTTDRRDGFYYQWSEDAVGFGSGDGLTIAGSGSSSVPAFAAETLLAPDATTLTQPIANKRGTFSLSTSRALQVAWTGGVAGRAMTFSAQATGTGTDVSLSCYWEAADGEDKIPADQMAAFAGATGGSITWGEESSKEFGAGGFEVQQVIDIYGSGPATFK